MLIELDTTELGVCVRLTAKSFEYEAASTELFTLDNLKALMISSIGKPIFNSFDKTTEALGFVSGASIYTNGDRSVLLIKTNVDIDAFIVPGYKHPSHEVVMYGAVMNPLDKTLKRRTKNV